MVGRLAGRASTQWTHLLKRRRHSHRPPFDGTPDAHGGHPYGRDELLVELELAHWPAHRHGCDRVTGIPDGRGYAPEAGQRFFAIERNAMCLDLQKFVVQLAGCRDRILGAAGQGCGSNTVPEYL